MEEQKTTSTSSTSSGGGGGGSDGDVEEDVPRKMEKARMNQDLVFSNDLVSDILT